MKGWYGPPIAVGGVPGKVFVDKDGEFRGKINTGKFASAKDIAEGIIKRAVRAAKKQAREDLFRSNMGFSSLSDMISEITSNGKKHVFSYSKTGTTGVAGVTNSLWAVGSSPAAGGAGAATPGGTATNSASTGAFTDLLNVSTDTQHFTGAYPNASVAANLLLMYDRLFHVTKTASSSTQESVTGVPTRYQNTTTTAADYIGGNFGFVEQFGVLASTAHNWTVCTYLDQGGSASTLPSIAGAAAGLVNRIDHAGWYMPLASGDTGLGSWTALQCSSASITGTALFCIGHPLCWQPCPIANFVVTVDGINTAISLVRIFDNACISFLEVNKPATTATTYTGTFETAWG